MRYDIAWAAPLNRRPVGRTVNELSKSARKAIRDAATIAYERELAQALRDLAQMFDEWKSGTRNTFDVADSIHEFHQGIARELFKRYEAGSTSVPDFGVAGAVMNGFMKLEEIDPDGREHIAKIVVAMSSLRSRRS